MSHDNEIRSFIAISLPSTVMNYLSDTIINLKSKFPDNSIKWVQPGNIHITIKFLGNVSTTTLNRLIGELEKEHDITRFSLSLTTIGAFPSIFKPQVIWVGLKEHESLTKLHQWVERTTQELNFKSDDKPFSPHLTIARLKPGIRNDHFQVIKQELYKNRDIMPVEFSVDHFSVYQSVLTSKDPIYSELRKYSLQT